MALIEHMVDMHCHYIPGIDDGVRTNEEGVELCEALARIGFEVVVSTPHIREPQYPNRRDDLRSAFDSFFLEARSHVSSHGALPLLGLAAEHHCDDALAALFERHEVLPYPGDRAILVEFPEDSIPLGIEQFFFRLRLRGLRPVLAHPERYTALFKKTTPIETLLNMEIALLLDVMSLTGHYGRAPLKAAERLLAENVIFAACSDSHRPSNVPVVQEGIDRLVRLVGLERATAMLVDNPKTLVSIEQCKN